MLKIYLLWIGLNSNNVRLLKSLASEPSLSHPQPPNFPLFIHWHQHWVHQSRGFSGMCKKRCLLFNKLTFKEVREVTWRVYYRGRPFRNPPYFTLRGPQTAFVFSLRPKPPLWQKENGNNDLLTVVYTFLLYVCIIIVLLLTMITRS